MAVTEPSLLLAVQTYVPESAIENLSMIKVPFLTEFRPFGKAANARVQVIFDGG